MKPQLSLLRKISSAKATCDRCPQGISGALLFQNFVCLSFCAVLIVLCLLRYFEFAQKPVGPLRRSRLGILLLLGVRVHAPNACVPVSEQHLCVSSDSTLRLRRSRLWEHRAPRDELRKQSDRFGGPDWVYYWRWVPKRTLRNACNLVFYRHLHLSSFLRCWLEG